MPGLLSDFLQGASNAAASTVTGPIDLLAMLMQKAGIPVPSNAVGSTQWAQQRGLIRQPQNRAAGLLGETAGLISPVVVSAKAPQIARGLLQMGENAAKPSVGMGQRGAIVYHGSPHKFDKFDSSKIGTGEGAQAYGHGLYLAESPDVAKSYQSALSADRGFSYGGKTGLTRAEVQDMVNAKYGGGYLDGVIRPSGVADSFIDDMVTGTGRAEGAYPRQYKPGSQRAKIYDELRGQIQHADPGSLYKVDLPDEAIAKMLDWDKPLSQQAPEVQAAVESIKQNLTGQFNRDMTGDQLLMHIQSTLKGVGRGSEKAEGVLRQQGIPGIRYLDGGSRGVGQGTSNFVVFPGEESLLRILERNGVGL